MANAITTEFRSRLVAGVGTVRPSPHGARHLPRLQKCSAEKGPEHAPCISVPFSRYAPCILTERRTGRRDTQTFVCVVSSARSFGGGRRQAVPWSPAAASRTVGPKLQVEALPRAPRGGRRVRGARCTTLLILQAPTSPQNTKIVTRGFFQNREHGK